jgi:hypothetical protein
MATKTGGTKTTTSLTVIQWQPAGVSAADLATINNAMRSPTVGSFGASVTGATGCGRLENGFLFLPARDSVTTVPAIQLQPGDWIMVDGAGWPIVVPNSIFSTSWQHS